MMDEPVAIPGPVETERRIEALLFAAAGPLSLDDLAKRLPERSDVEAGIDLHAALPMLAGNRRCRQESCENPPNSTPLRAKVASRNGRHRQFARV